MSISKPNPHSHTNNANPANHKVNHLNPKVVRISHPPYFSQNLFVHLDAPYGQNDPVFVARTMDPRCYSNWADVYKDFRQIENEVYSNIKDVDIAHEITQRRIDDLYAQHKGEPLWDMAYVLWDEEVN